MRRNTLLRPGRDHGRNAGRGPAIYPVILLLALHGCAGGRGDLGRDERGPVREVILPAAGRIAALARMEPASGFMLTDAERVLRDRSWNFVSAPHADDWFTNIFVEGQRTRITRPSDHMLNPKRYYALLRSTDYASSETRYGRVISDTANDSQLLPGFFMVAEDVLAADAERLRVLSATAGASKGEITNVHERVDENREVISWTCRAMSFRIASYSYALERLQMETPSTRAAELYASLDRLVRNVSDSPCNRAADDNSFWKLMRPEQAEIPSRFSLAAAVADDDDDRAEQLLPPK